MLPLVILNVYCSSVLTQLTRISSNSPGVMIFLNLTRLNPVTCNFFEAHLEIRSTTSFIWAIPGSIGFPGKWPANQWSSLPIAIDAFSSVVSIILIDAGIIEIHCDLRITTHFDKNPDCAHILKIVRASLYHLRCKDTTGN